MDLFGRDDKDGDLLVAHHTPLAGQFAQQWKLGMMAQEAAPKEVANSKLRHLSACKTSSNRTDVEIGDSALSRA